MGIKDKRGFNIMGVNEKFDFSERVQEKKQYIWGIPWKEEGFDILQI